MVPEPHGGGRGQGDPPGESVDALIRRTGVKKQHPPAGDGLHGADRSVFQRVNRLEILQRQTGLWFLSLCELREGDAFSSEILTVEQRQPLASASPPGSLLSHCSFWKAQAHVPSSLSIGPSYIEDTPGTSLGEHI